MFHLLWNFGVRLNGVAVSTVQQAMTPIILAVAARIVFKEAFDTRKIIAVVLTLSGAFFISGLICSGGESRSMSASVLVGFAIPIAYAMFNLFGKRITGKYHPITILTYGFGFGAACPAAYSIFCPRRRRTFLRSPICGLEDSWLSLRYFRTLSIPLRCGKSR